MKISSALFVLMLLFGCSKNETSPEPLNTEHKETAATANAVQQQSYLALGDSYTIGESVSQSQSFPYQLVSKLNSRGKNFAAPKVIARTGWTTADLQKAVTAANITKKYDFVSLLIGVNNQFQGLSKSTYRSQFRDLLNRAIKFSGGKPNHVAVISIPDWGQTPYGQRSGRDTKKITEEIAAFNKINKEEATARGVIYTNITPTSYRVTSDPSLVAQDGLHYSGKMHALWVDAIISSFNKAN